MLEIINYLDSLGMYRLADMVDKKVIAENNFQPTKKHKNINQNLQMQIFSLQQKLRDMDSQNSSGDSGSSPLKKTKDNSSNKNTNIQYLSNAPLDIDNNGNNNNTKVEITT